MNRPWFPLHSRDWLDNKELRRCSPLSRAILADLMCLANEGEPYGFLADKVGPLTSKFIANRCQVSARQLQSAVSELKAHARISEDESGSIFIPRMVDDERVRLARASGGLKSIGHPNTHPPRSKEGYPSDHPLLEIDSCAGARADSDSLLRSFKRKEDAPDFQKVNEAWKWYQEEFPGDVNTFMETRLFLAVMETDQDLSDLRDNLPLYKLTKNWIEGFCQSSENFLSKRIFKIRPKMRDSPSTAKSIYVKDKPMTKEEMAEYGG